MATAFVKKVAVESRVAGTNEYVTQLELLTKFGAGVYSPGSLNHEKLKVFQTMSRRTVFQQSTAVADLAQDSSDSEFWTDDGTETVTVAPLAVSITPQQQAQHYQPTRRTAIDCHQSSDDDESNP